jgi:putative tryptophan/tyrosine transport system substrate-binding protein
MSTAEDDVESRARIDAFLQELARFGWTVGRNLQVDIRWPGGDADRIRRNAAERIALAPDVMLAMGATVGSLQQATQSVPIVFAIVADPVGGGLVESLARPETTPPDLHLLNTAWAGSGSNFFARLPLALNG